MIKYTVSLGKDKYSNTYYYWKKREIEHHTYVLQTL